MMLRLTLVLAALCLIAALALGLVYRSTAARIETQMLVADDLARRSVLPEAAAGVFVRAWGAGLVYYRGYRNADTTGLVGYTTEATGRGYASAIRTVIGLDPTGRITGIKITYQKETPGLGSKIAEVRTTRTVLDAVRSLVGKEPPRRAPGALSTQATPWFQAQFVGMREADLVVARQGADTAVQATTGATPYSQKTQQNTQRSIQAVTGATISSQAVTLSVKGAIVELEKAIGGFGEATG